MTQDKNNPRSLKALYDETVREINAASMTPAMQAARDRVVEAAKAELVAYHSWVDSIGGESIDETMNRLDAWVEAESEMKKSVTALLALEAQEKEQADAEG